MCFGLMGVFRWIAWRGRFCLRYLSDASYWIYLCHLPLIIASQLLTVSWPVSPHLKFTLLCLSVTGILVVVYQIGVRYTPVGTLLDGRSTGRSAQPEPIPAGGSA